MTFSDNNQFENIPGFNFNPKRACLDKFCISFDKVPFKISKISALARNFKELCFETSGLKFEQGSNQFAIIIDGQYYLFSGSIRITRSTLDKDICFLHVSLNLNLMRFLSHQDFKHKYSNLSSPSDLELIIDNKYFWRRRNFLALNDDDNFLPQPFTDISVEYDFNKNLNEYLNHVEKFLLNMIGRVFPNEVDIQFRFSKWFITQAEVCWDFINEQSKQTVLDLKNCISRYNAETISSSHALEKRNHNGDQLRPITIKTRIHTKSDKLQIKCYAKTSRLLRIEIVFIKSIRNILGKNGSLANFPNNSLGEISPFFQFILEYSSKKAHLFFEQTIPITNNLQMTNHEMFIQFFDALDYIVGSDILAKRRFRNDFLRYGCIDANNTYTKTYLRKLLNRGLITRYKTNERDGKKVYRISDKFRPVFDKIIPIFDGN